MNSKNSWKIAAPLLVSLLSLRATGVAEAQAKDCSVVSAQKSDVKVDYTAGSAGKAGTNVGRGQQAGTGVTSRAAASAMIHVAADDPTPAADRVAVAPEKDSAPNAQVSRR